MKIKESETIETKKSVAQLKESLKSISAILNKHRKGSLFFGIALILEKESDAKFEQVAGIFITIFKRKIIPSSQSDLIPQSSGGLSGGIKNVYEFIKNNSGYNTNYISEAVSAPRKTVEKWIKKLKKYDLIEFKGSKKTGGYNIKS